MNNGINALIAVTQMKVHNSNDAAMSAADQQRDLVRKQQLVRAAQDKLNQLVSDGNYSTDDMNDNYQNFLFLEDNGIDVGDTTATNGRFTKYNDGTIDSAGDNAQKQQSEVVDGLKQALEGAMKDLENQDRMGNFNIQRLMSQYNQSEQLSSSVQKKVDDTASAIIGKVG
ncbi:MAG: hypothetical protein RMA76_33575 [Deltaproteobacteria bacterium]|jgi:hypothetical protein